MEMMISGTSFEKSFRSYGSTQKMQRCPYPRTSAMDSAPEVMIASCMDAHGAVLYLLFPALSPRKKKKPAEPQNRRTAERRPGGIIRKTNCRSPTVSPCTKTRLTAVRQTSRFMGCIARRFGPVDLTYWKSRRNVGLHGETRPYPAGVTMIVMIS